MKIIYSFLLILNSIALLFCWTTGLVFAFKDIPFHEKIIMVLFSIVIGSFNIPFIYSNYINLND